MSTSSDDEYGAYYWQDIIFSVEGQLFKVPKTYFVQHSEIFRDMFTLPNMGTNAEGTSDQNPLRLEGIKKKDFVRLLRVIYPRSLNNDIKTAEEWSSVLKLSLLWNFTDVQKLAIRSLTMSPGVAPAQKVKLGLEHNIRFWAVRGGVELVKRSERLSIQEGGELGIMATVVIAGVRESYRQILQHPRARHPYAGPPVEFPCEDYYSYDPVAAETQKDLKCANLVAHAFGWKYEEVIEEEEKYKAN
ncbi:hypothetical protein JAAARDRAFT_41435 [Jaapia argillacea MUCL 33604]|uniref:BTB domain-containing protein n=1 Tax=Jaapia argillacea MUCL 33604 TaxID=933084 RepID=A0A067PBG3_9AGAM|nr:hypothetical protein JAAARDRAFT_41435 [Jaapia argillacea MUCL 33604]